MKLIFTMDNNNAVRFCGKRQSKDRAVADKILDLTNGNLYVEPSTAGFFLHTKSVATFHVVDSIKDVPDDAYFFVEHPLLPSELFAAEEIHVFRWNRQYPSTKADRINIPGLPHVTEEFPGYSHKKITWEVYADAETHDIIIACTLHYMYARCLW